jgi:colicin import membrane protein
MAERKESSVLFSLRELKDIESQRQREEEEAARRAEAERLQALRNAEEQARAAERAAIEAQAAAERAHRERLEQQAREERMQLESAERQARQKAQAALDQQRMARELEIQQVLMRKKRPVALKLIAGTLVAGLLSLGVFLFFQMHQARAKEQQFQKELLAMRENIAAKETEYDRLLTDDDRQFAQLIASKSVEERKELQRRWEQNQAKLARQAEELAQLREIERNKRQREQQRQERIKQDAKKIKTKNCDPNDPLCGI